MKKWILLPVSLLIAACGQSLSPASEPATGGLGTAALSLSGTLVNYDSANSLPSIGGGLDGARGYSGASSAIDASGHFALTLPPPGDLSGAPTLAALEFCSSGGQTTGSVTISPADTHYAPLILAVQDSNHNTFLVNQLAGSAANLSRVVYDYLWADQAASMTGTLICGSGSEAVTVNYALKLDKGWNSVAEAISSGSAGNQFTFSTAPVSASAAWTIIR